MHRGFSEERLATSAFRYISIYGLRIARMER